MFATNYHSSSKDDPSFGSARTEASDVPGSPMLLSPDFDGSRPVARLDAPRDADSSILVLPVRMAPASSSRFETVTSKAHQSESAAAAASAVTTEVTAETPLHAKEMTFLPHGWRVEGSIETNDPTRINCHVVGQIAMADGVPMVLEPLSVLDGKATSTQIDVHGTVHGDLLAGGGKVVIHATSRIQGEVQYQDVQILGGIHEMLLKHTTQRA